MKEIWMMRHGDNEVDPDFARYGIWQPQSSLTLAGVAKLSLISEEYFNGMGFEICLHSPMVRTKETGMIILPNSDWIEEPLLGPKNITDLDLIYKKNHPNNLSDIEKLLPGFCGHVQKRVISVVEGSVSELTANQKAIIIGHEPSLTLTLSTFVQKYNAYVKLLEKGSICVLMFTDNNIFYEFKELSLE
jgi:phosphohistidine phosphatase SixA